jgi:hypothetical protein
VRRTHPASRGSPSQTRSTSAQASGDSTTSPRPACPSAVPTWRRGSPATR